MKHRRFLIFLCILLALPVAARADAPTNTSHRDDAVAEVFRLIEVQRYGDAIPACTQAGLIAPEDAAFYEACGALALHIGAADQATQDFQAARVEAPANDPVPAYGLGLCALIRRDLPEARAQLAEALTHAPDENKPQVAFALAAVDLASGNADKALAETQGSDLPAARELSAVIASARKPSDTALLQAFLDAGRINGVPRVVEPSGLRLLCARTAQESLLEPSVVEPPLQANLAGRLARESGLASGDGAERMSGRVTVQPRRGFGGVVSLSVDGHVVGVNNAPPYAFTWDTREVVNGKHVLSFSVIDDSGTTVGAEDRSVTVVNGDKPSHGASRPLTPALQWRLWNLLTLQPAYKVAEWRCAQIARARGDRAGYARHLLTAAALDPEYQNVHAKIAALFSGQVPAHYPLPATFKRGGLGLSAGQVSDAGLWIGNPQSREIALTFDDGPTRAPTTALLDALKPTGARVTFFVVGMRAAEFPDLLQRMAADGDAVEDHSYSHPNLDQVLPEHILQEILRTGIIVQSQTGHWPRFLRPPGGNTNPHVLETARACGMAGAFWTIDALPAEESGSADAVTKWVVSRARSGADRACCTTGCPRPRRPCHV